MSAAKPPYRALLLETLAAWNVSLDGAQWGLLDKYLRDVLEYNRKVNLTAARGEGELARRHLLDALAALPALRPKLGPAPRMADLGAGAGFLGVCLKIAWPEAVVTLVESAYRKFCFLNWTASRLGLKGLRVARVLSPGERYDAVLARAVAPLPELVKLALPAVPGGLLAAYQSERPSLESEAALGPRARLEAVYAYRLPQEDRDRHILLIRSSP